MAADRPRALDADETLQRVAAAALSMQRYSWEQGVLAQAFLELGEEETAIRMAVEAVNRRLPDGRCAQMGPPDAATDPCAVGEALIFACERTGDDALCAARDALLRWALTGAPRNGAGVVYHLTGSRQFWVDSMYMLPPFLARAGAYEAALIQIDGYWRALCDADTGLLFHQWDDGAGRYVRRALWGVGNGWAVAGLARVIALLPPEYADARRRLIARAEGLLRAAMALRMSDGRFHDVLDDAGTFPEVNAGQMFAYALYRGVGEGWLPEDWLDDAEILRRAARASVDELGFVRGVCGAPRFDAPGIAPEGQAFFMLMEAARGKLFS